MTFAAVLVCTTTPAAQQGVFRSATQTVPIYATVIDQDQHLLTNLTKDDFEVFDNGRPQPITLFDTRIQPISIIIMLDMSGSMTGNLTMLRSAAVQMFTRLLPDDKARVGNFGDRINIGPTFTNNQDDLIRTLYLDLTPGGPTPLWGAINAAMTGLAHLEGRRVVLVLSDGKDSTSLPFGGGRPSVSLDSVTLRAQTEEFMIYAIGLRSRNRPGGGFAGPLGRGGGRMGGGFGGGTGDEPDPGLRDLALESGGGYFELTGNDDLGETFARVADELHRQYLVGFVAPDADGKLHQVDLRVRAPHLAVRARKSYLAPKKAA